MKSLVCRYDWFRCCLGVVAAASLQYGEIDFAHVGAVLAVMPVTQIDLKLKFRSGRWSLLAVQPCSVLHFCPTLGFLHSSPAGGGLGAGWGLVDLKDLIGFYIRQYLSDTTRPANLDTRC